MARRCIPDLPHGQEERVYGDCAYAAQQELIRVKAPGAANFTNSTLRKGSVTEGLERLTNRAKSRRRARVEHASPLSSAWEGFNKVRYRGLRRGQPDDAGAASAGTGARWADRHRRVRAFWR